MKINVDLPDSDGLSLVAPGWHRARVFEVDCKTASSGVEYLRISFEITDGPYARRRVWDGFSLQPRALWRLKRLLKAVGLPHSGPVVLGTALLESKSLDIQVITEIHRDEKRSAVKDMRAARPGPTAPPTAPSPQEKKEIPF